MGDSLSGDVEAAKLSIVGLNESALASQGYQLSRTNAGSL